MFRHWENQFSLILIYRFVMLLLDVIVSRAEKRCSIYSYCNRILTDLIASRMINGSIYSIKCHPSQRCNFVVLLKIELSIPIDLIGINFDIDWFWLCSYISNLFNYRKFLTLKHNHLLYFYRDFLNSRIWKTSVFKFI